MSEREGGESAIDRDGGTEEGEGEDRGEAERLMQLLTPAGTGLLTILNSSSIFSFPSSSSPSSLNERCRSPLRRGRRGAPESDSSPSWRRLRSVFCSVSERERGSESGERKWNIEWR